MGENLSRKFATMSEEERRRYELEMEEADAARDTDEAKQELEFGEPRRDHSASPAPRSCPLVRVGLVPSVRQEAR